MIQAVTLKVTGQPVKQPRGKSSSYHLPVLEPACQKSCVSGYGSVLNGNTCKKNVFIDILLLLCQMSWCLKIPPREAPCHHFPVPREPARRAWTHRTVSAADGQGIIPPASPPPPSADLLLKLYSDPWRSSTAPAFADLARSRLLYLPAAAGGPQNHFTVPSPLSWHDRPPARSSFAANTDRIIWQADSNTCKCLNAITVCKYWKR